MTYSPYIYTKTSISDTTESTLEAVLYKGVTFLYNQKREVGISIIHAGLAPQGHQ